MDLGSYSFTNEDLNNNAKALTWRSNPEESFSDWTIIVNQTDQYNVHKNFMGAGLRSSQYFARLFASNMTETKSSTSHLELEDTAAKAFPEMLDFMYGCIHPVRATTETAVALRSLSNYLGIPSLWESVKEFIERDLNIFSAPLYLQEATKYQDDAMIKVANKICVSQFTRLRQHPTALAVLSPNLVRSIVKQRFENYEMLGNFLTTNSKALSVCVASYCQNTKFELDAAFFREVTNPKYMPTVQAKVVPSLLRAAIDVQFLNEEDVTDDDDDGVQDNNDTKSNAKNLLRRCRTTAKSSWDDAVFPFVISKKKTKKRKHADMSDGECDEQEEPKDEYSSLPAYIRATLLEEALIGARQNLETSVRRVSRLTQSLDVVNENLDIAKKKLEKYRKCIFIGKPDHVTSLEVEELEEGEEEEEED